MYDEKRDLGPGFSLLSEPTSRACFIASCRFLLVCWGEGGKVGEGGNKELKPNTT